MTCFAVQVVVLMVNSSQSSSMSFAYVATPGGKESLQSFGMAVAMLSEEGKCCWCRDCRLVHVCCLVRVRDVYLRLWGSGPVLALNCEDL